MKQLITTAAILVLSLNSYATKAQGKKTRPVAMDCAVYSLEKGEKNSPEKMEEVPGSDFIVELQAKGKGLYQGAEKIRQSKEKTLEVSVRVYDHGFKNTIKIEAVRTAGKEVLDSGFGSNKDDKNSRDVEVVMNKGETLICSLVEKTLIYKNDNKDDKKNQ